MKLHRQSESWKKRPAPADETVEVQLNQVSVMWVWKYNEILCLVLERVYFSEVVFPARALFL